MPDPVYQADQWLKRATGLLEASKVPSARLDALILLEDTLGKDRAYLLAHPETEISAENSQKLEKQLIRRAAHEPLAYIRGKSEFYGREYMISPATLQPRPETETMITLLKELPLPKSTVVADIGTGSGAIAITAKLELPRMAVFATEIQADALRIAQDNAKKLGVEVEFYEGNLLEPLINTELDVILANLPYVPNSHTINQAAMQEPEVAIFGGDDGLDLYRKMLKQINQRSQKPRYILTESLPFQHNNLANIAVKAGYEQELSEDFIQVFRLT